MVLNFLVMHFQAFSVPCKITKWRHRLLCASFFVWHNSSDVLLYYFQTFESDPCQGNEYIARRKYEVRNINKVYFAFLLRTSLPSRCWRAEVLIWFIILDDGVSEHEAGVSAAAVRPELDQEDRRTADERLQWRLVATQRRRQQRVRVSVEQLNVITGTVRWRLDWQAMYVHFEHLHRHRRPQIHATATESSRVHSCT